MAQTLEQLIIELKADVSGLRAGLTTAQGDLRKFSDTADKHVGVVSRSLASLKSQALGAIGGFIALSGAMNFARSAGQAAMNMESLRVKMAASVGSAASAADALTYTRKEAERLGLVFTDLADGYASFSAAALRAGLATSEVRTIFTGVSEAAAAMQLPAERVQLVFTALSQMASKGVVSMEELRQQLGESLPGAVQIFAKAMGVTNAEFIKMVESGQVSAKELTKLGTALSQEFGQKAVQAAGSARGAMNLLTTAVNDLKVNMAGGESLKTYQAAMVSMTAAINDPAVKEGLAVIANGIAWITASAVTGIATIAKWAAQLTQSVADAVKSISIMGMHGRGVGATAGPMQTDGQPLASNAELFGMMGGKTTGPAGSTGGSIGGGGGSQRDNLKEQVDSLRTQLASETQQLAIEYEERQKLLEKALEQKAITEQEYRDLSLQAELDYKNQYGELWAQQSEERIRKEEEANSYVLNARKSTMDSVIGLLGVFGSKSKAFAIAQIAFEKAKGISEALIAGKVAAAKAIAIYGPTPQGFAAASQAIAFSQVQAGLIAATGIAEAAMSGKGGGGGSGGGDVGSSAGVSTDSSGATASAVQAPRNINIHIDGEYWGPTQLRSLVNNLNEFMGDGSLKLNVVGASAA